MCICFNTYKHSQDILHLLVAFNPGNSYYINISLELFNIMTLLLAVFKTGA